MAHWRTVSLALIRSSQAIHGVGARVHSVGEGAVRGTQCNRRCSARYATQKKVECGDSQRHIRNSAEVRGQTDSAVHI